MKSGTYFDSRVTQYFLLVFSIEIFELFLRLFFRDVPERSVQLRSLCKKTTLDAVSSGDDAVAFERPHQRIVLVQSFYP